MIRPFAALTINGFREARRHRVSVVVGGFAVAILLCSTLVAEITVYSMERVLTNFGLGVMSMTLVLLAIFLSCSLLSKEIERKTIFLVVSKPVSRTLFILGRFAGTALTLLTLLVAMTLLFLAQCKLYGAPFHWVQVQAAFMLWIELLVLCSVGFAISSFSSQLVSAVVTMGIYFCGHFSSDIYSLSQRSESQFIRGLGKSIYYALPNLERLNLRDAAAYSKTVSWAEIGPSVAYALCYAAVMLSIAVILFRRRDFK
jgi:ABC-type transport system involved in multi-copper enzyme maturation permease subunit